MRRRSFLKYSSTAAAAALLPSTFAQQSAALHAPKKPKVLPSGSTLGLVAPASSVSEEQFEKTLSNVSQLGYRCTYSPKLRLRKGFLAGTDSSRLSDLHRAFQDPSIDGILCVRGGYGCMRLLNKIDYNSLRPHLKPLIGFSDITALHIALYNKLDWVGLHGPMGGSDFSDFSVSAFKELLQGGGKGYRVSPYPQPAASADKGPILDTCWTIVAGKAKGRLMGGNLTMICALLGTPYSPRFDDCIVFLEEVGERPYRIDRMLTQLHLSGVLRRARGLVLGVFSDCEEPLEYFNPTAPVYLEEVIKERLSTLRIPVLYGLPFGHVQANAILPVGIEAELNTFNKSITLQESALR